MSNNKIRSLSDFAEWCYVVIDEKLCIVKRGEKGWKYAQIGAENYAANHELAVLKNKELGVTPEQARLLATGAIVGWDVWITPEKQPAASHVILKVKISKTGAMGEITATILNLPATPYEIIDALEKAHRTQKS